MASLPPAALAPTDVAADAARFAQDFRRNHPLQYWVTLLGPFTATAVAVALLAMAQGYDFTVTLLVRALAAFFFFGKFAILEPQSLLSAEVLFLLVLYMDLIVAVFVSFHSHLLFRIPVLGPRLQGLASDGAFVMESQPWMRRMTFVGLVAFVMFPLAATGSIGGAIFGRLLGLRRRTTFVGVASGSLLGCGLMYFGAEFIRDHIDPDDPALKIGGIVFVAAVVIALNRRYQSAKAKRGY